MKIDNTELIREKLDFSIPNDFYFVEIIKRRKENPDMEKREDIIDMFEIHSLKSFDKHIDEMKEIARNNNARIYLKLNRRNKKKVALELLRELSYRIANDDYNVRNLYHSILGKYSSDKNKKWILDVDNSSLDLVSICTRLQELYIESKRYDSEMFVIPTLNGNHIICSPFDVSKFKWLAENNIEIHKDNGTILFYESLNDK